MPATTATLDLFSDGGARGNPGPAATGFVISHQSRILFQSGRYLGSATNNQAEYYAIIDGLTWLLVNPQSQFNTCICHLDSLVVVNQITNQFKVKTPHLVALYSQVQTLIDRSPIDIEFRHIPRHQNHLADSIVNQILDQFQDNPSQLV